VKSSKLSSTLNGKKKNVWKDLPKKSAKKKRLNNGHVSRLRKKQGRSMLNICVGELSPLKGPSVVTRTFCQVEMTKLAGSMLRKSVVSGRGALDTLPR